MSDFLPLYSNRYQNQDLEFLNNEFISVYMKQLSDLVNEHSEGRIAVEEVKAPVWKDLNKYGALNYLIYTPKLIYTPSAGKRCEYDLMVTKGIDSWDIGELAGPMGRKEAELIDILDIKFSIADISKMSLPPIGRIDMEEIKDAIKIFRTESKLRFQSIAAGKNIGLIRHVLNFLNGIVKFFNPNAKIGFFDKFALTNNLEEAVKVFVEEFEKIIQKEE